MPDIYRSGSGQSLHFDQRIPMPSQWWRISVDTDGMPALAGGWSPVDKGQGARAVQWL